MKRIVAFISAVAAASLSAGAAPLMVISVDGLNYRYLRHADQLRLEIPNIRKLMRDGVCVSGVVGVWPTVTWQPAHIADYRRFVPTTTARIAGPNPRAAIITGAPAC